MKGSITIEILETINERASNVGDLISAFLSAGHGASLSSVQYRADQRWSKRENEHANKENAGRIKQKYYNLVYKLKKDGLLKENLKNNKNILSLTEKGRDKLKMLLNRREQALPETKYKKDGAANLVIVIFDVPEKERRKRAWLRDALNNIGLELIQKSVWIGRAKIPPQFLKDLADLKLINFVEIFEITKAGSLKHIV